MDALTGSNLLTALVVVVAVAEAFNLATKTLQNIKSVKKPARDLADTIETQQRMLANDKKRLDTLENGLNAVSKALLAMLNHEITGNNVEKLKEAQTDLTSYLINR